MSALELAEAMAASARQDLPTDCSGTRLHWLCFNGGSAAAIADELAAGVDASATDSAGQTCAHYAARMGRAGLLRALLSHSTTLASVPNDASGRTPLFEAVRVGARGVARLLLRAGASATARDDAGATPLHHAAFCADGATCIDVLIGAGADSNAADLRGTRPAAIAAARGNLRFLQRLGRRGADLSAGDADGTTPLHWAAFYGHPGTARFLVEATQVSELPVDKSGRTPLDAALGSPYCPASKRAKLKALLLPVCKPSPRARAQRGPSTRSRERGTVAVLSHGNRAVPIVVDTDESLGDIRADVRRCFGRSPLGRVRLMRRDGNEVESADGLGDDFVLVEFEDTPVPSETSSIAESEDGREPPAEFVCCITGALMRDPHIASDGHSYERFAIEMWLDQSDRSPMTGVPLASRQLIPNLALRNAIERWMNSD